MIRTLIVDDEQPARSRLRTLLQEHADIELAGECADGESALARIMGGGIDLVLLDVEMPRLSGLALVELTPQEAMPVVIFVSAHGDYAMHAFDARAIDYLLKPCDRARLDVALARARHWLAAGERRSQPHSLVGASARVPHSAATRPSRIAVRSRGRISIIKVESIDWVAAEGNYVRFHAGAQSYLDRQSLQQVEELFDPATFVRVHRSAIVNLDRVKEIRIDARGETRVLLADDTTIPLGRAFRDDLERRLAS